MMPGMMMDRPLLISALIEHAERFHGAVPIVARDHDGGLVRTTYAAAASRARRLARALLRLGVRPGERVATMAWNGHRHFELYYAISGIGAVMHTINPRLFEDQIAYIANHAQDTLLRLRKQCVCEASVGGTAGSWSRTQLGYNRARLGPARQRDPIATKFP